MNVKSLCCTPETHIRFYVNYPVSEKSFTFQKKKIKGRLGNRRVARRLSCEMGVVWGWRGEQGLCEPCQGPSPYAKRMESRSSILGGDISILQTRVQTPHTHTHTRERGSSNCGRLRELLSPSDPWHMCWKMPIIGLTSHSSWAIMWHNPSADATLSIWGAVWMLRKCSPSLPPSPFPLSLHHFFCLY